MDESLQPCTSAPSSGQHKTTVTYQLQHDDSTPQRISSPPIEVQPFQRKRTTTDELLADAYETISSSKRKPRVRISTDELLNTDINCTVDLEVSFSLSFTYSYL